MRSAADKQLLWPAQLKRRANPISRIVCCAQAAAVRQGQGRGPSREGQAGWWSAEGACHADALAEGGIASAATSGAMRAGG
jgi:hypothetical protein